MRYDSFFGWKRRTLVLRADVAIPLKKVLDTSVLLPMPLCDTLLRAAEQGLYRPVGSDDILAELVRNLAEWVGATAAQKRVAEMETVFPDARATDYDHFTDTMTNHPKDRHVLAATVASGAVAIVTANLRDFPDGALRPFGIVAQSPDAFLVDLFHQAPSTMRGILAEQAHQLSRPPMTLSDLLEDLAREAPSFARLVRTE